MALLASDGTPLVEYSLPARSTDYCDEADDRVQGGLRGRPVECVQDERVLNVPMPADTAYIHFYKAGVSATETVASGRPAVAKDAAGGALSHLSWYRVRPMSGPGTDLAGSTLVPSTSDQARELPWVAPLHKAARALKWGDEQGSPEMRLCDELRHYSGPPAERFNIVVLGDGFGVADQDLYEQKAGVLVKGLMHMRPFSTCRDDINIFVVAAVSADSGVDASPRSKDKKDTVFDVCGNYGNVESNGFFGTRSHAKVRNAASLAVPLHLVNLTIMVVNSTIYGGSAFPAHREAYVSIGKNEELFVRVAAHESGHVIARLADEYIGDQPPPVPWVEYPNLATVAELNAHAVPWAHLARAKELKQDGSFLVQHLGGDPINPVTQEPIVSKDRERCLGAFWGCMYIRPTKAGVKWVDSQYDGRGHQFLRPMRRCLMRRTSWSLCRVCCDALTEVIRTYSRRTKRVARSARQLRRAGAGAGAG